MPPNLLFINRRLVCSALRHLAFRESHKSPQRVGLGAFGQRDIFIACFANKGRKDILSFAYNDELRCGLSLEFDTGG